MTLASNSWTPNPKIVSLTHDLMGKDDVCQSDCLSWEFELTDKD